MNKDLEKIEIRSQKVRDVMNEEPPFLIRQGTTIITLLLLLSISFIYLII